VPLIQNIHHSIIGTLANRKSTVDVTTLSVPQLRSLQTRLNSELEQLTNSHAKLRAAQSKFRDCVRTINDGVVGKKTPQPQSADNNNSILVPLTSSLYVKGKLADREKVIVDVGTGFYVEKVKYSLKRSKGVVLHCFANKARSI
jgi:prefoldin alpha subunit